MNEIRVSFDDLIALMKRNSDLERQLGEVKAELKKRDGWIDWSGGECPVEAGQEVEVKFRRGTGTVTTVPQYLFWGEISEDPQAEIVAYRIIQDKGEQCKKLRESEAKYASLKQLYEASEELRKQLRSDYGRAKSQLTALEKAADEMAAELEKKSAAVERMGRRIQRLEAERAGWVTHSAFNRMPVLDNDYVEVRRRNGSTTSGYAYSFTWGFQGEHTIVAYRVTEHPKANKAPTPCSVF